MSHKLNTEKLEVDGYTVVEDFLTKDEIEELTQGCWDVVDQEDMTRAKTVFVTGSKQVTNKYFMESADKVRLFYEDGAFDESGDLKVDKRHAFNKIGHSLHMLNAPFRKLTFSHKVQAVMRDIGYVDPVIFQSTCIFKPPRIGGVVAPHQDMTYLYVDTGKLVALWLALEDADVDNSCLHFIPGSHKDGVHNGRRLVLDAHGTEECTTRITADRVDYDPAAFVPVPVKKGTLVAFDGCAVHTSAANTSDKSRLAYVMHVYDAHRSVYSTDNWLQPTDGGTFAHLYTTSPEMANHVAH